LWVAAPEFAEQLRELFGVDLRARVVVRVGVPGGQSGVVGWGPLVEVVAAEVGVV
jgi:hypothetical protein